MNFKKCLLTNIYLILSLTLILSILSYKLYDLENEKKAYKATLKIISTLSGSFINIERYRQTLDSTLYKEFDDNIIIIKQILKDNNIDFRSNLVPLKNLLDKFVLVRDEFEKITTSFDKIGDESIGLISKIDKEIKNTESEVINWRPFKQSLIRYKMNPSIINRKLVIDYISKLALENKTLEIKADIITNINLILIYSEYIGFYDSAFDPFEKIRQLKLDFKLQETKSHNSIVNEYLKFYDSVVKELIIMIIIVVLFILIRLYLFGLEKNKLTKQPKNNMSSFLDLSEQDSVQLSNLKALQAVTAMSRDNFKVTLDNIPDATCRFNVNCYILSVNYNFKNLLNLNYSDLIATSLYDIIPNLDSLMIGTLESSTNDHSVTCSILGVIYSMQLTIIPALDAIHGQDEYQITISPQ